MISNIIVILLVIWALGYSGYRLIDFIKSAGSDKPAKCSCSSCPYVEKKHKKNNLTTF